mmetsp:Transcript_39332/g.94641  ORF Transcript_39332/g.94641 Transcript_39332/m.94641 type:complete len:250 (-) Transcript_39332:1976-2725(-)
MENTAPPASMSALKPTSLLASSIPMSNTAFPVSKFVWIFPTSPSNCWSPPSFWLILASFDTVNITSPGEMGRPLELVISTVANPASPVRRDLLSTETVLRAMAARHRATMSEGSSVVASSESAASLKCSAVSSATDLQAIALVFAAAPNAASVEGGPRSSNLNPCPRPRSIRTMSRAWFCWKSTTEMPFAPALPVLPDRCTYVSVSRGGWNWMTRSTSLMSMPRAATSVATRTLNDPARKAARVASRCF